jgi:4-amino-4-deoxy-L-arabinose transferase-like glycosyltransferase
VRTDGEFIRRAIWVHQVERALHPFEGHSGPLLFYPLSLLIGFFPGVALLALWLGRQRREQDHAEEAGSRSLATRFLICWAVFPFFFFTPLATKLPHYILPAYPPLSLLGAWGFLAARSTGGRWVSLALLVLLTLVMTAVAVAASSLATEFIPKGVWDRLMESIRPTLILSGCLLLAATGLMMVGVVNRRMRWPMGAALLLAVTWIIVGIRLLPSLEPIRAFPNLGRDVREAGIERVLCAWTPEPSFIYHGRVRFEKVGSPERLMERLVGMDSDGTSPGIAALLTETEWASVAGTAGVAWLATREGLNVANGEWGRWVLVVPGGADQGEREPAAW